MRTQSVPLVRRRMENEKHAVFVIGKLKQAVDIGGIMSWLTISNICLIMSHKHQQNIWNLTKILCVFLLCLCWRNTNPHLRGTPGSSNRGFVVVLNILRATAASCWFQARKQQHWPPHLAEPSFTLQVIWFARAIFTYFSSIFHPMSYHEIDI